MKKVVLCALIVISGLVILTGCGKKSLSAYAGTYELEYQKYVGDPDTAKTQESWTFVLNEDGTGKSNRDGNSYNVEWSIDGENIKVSEKFLGITNEYNGTLKNDKLDLFNGEKTDDLTLEAVFNKK